MTGDADRARSVGSSSLISRRITVDLPEPVDADEEYELAPIDRERRLVEADVAGVELGDVRGTR